MEIEEIIEEIKSNLNGDSDHDKAYLASQMEKYREHEFGWEISLEIGRLLWTALTDEEKEEFAKISEEEAPVMRFMEELQPLLENDRIPEALEKMDEFVETYPFTFWDNARDEYHIFNNPIEHILFLETYDGDKNIRLIPPNSNYFMIFNLYGSLLLAAGRAEEAKDAYLRALKYNPVDDDVLMKLMMYYDGIEIDNKKVEEYAKDIIRYSYNPENIALAYRFLGYWYYKYNDFETTTSVYLLSLLFEDHITAWMDLALMDDFINLKEVDAIARLKEMDIPVGANPKLFEILPNIIDEAGKIRDENFKQYSTFVLDNLVKPDEILGKIEKLKENGFDEKIAEMKKSMGM